MCEVENKGEGKRCRRCSGRYSSREKIIWEINRERRKKKARLLSFIFPGLGHLYSGRYATGIVWMAMIPLTLGLVLNTYQGFTKGHLFLAFTFLFIWYLSVKDAGRGHGTILAPCESACPSHLHVPDYIALVREGAPLTSLALIHEYLPFASVCGRICPHPCEDVCVRNEIGAPISIAAIKRYAADIGYTEGRWPKKIAENGNGNKNKKVAIIGAGPAGLSAANTLSLLGVKCVVFDRGRIPGGMMATCIPTFRLPREELAKDVNFIISRGVEFRGGVNVGEDVSFDEMIKGDEFDALLIAVGTSEALKLPKSGNMDQGFLDAFTFLSAAMRGDELPIGERVVIVGGGNVAIDSARVALRLGSKRVTLVCLESREIMPAFPWEVEEALDEGALLVDGTAVKKFFVMRNRVAGFEALKVERIEFDKMGRINPVTVPGSEFEIGCDTVIMAIGSREDLSFVREDYSVKLLDRIHHTGRLIFKDRKGRIPAYICGDCLAGPTTIVESSASGRHAALNIFEEICVEEVKKVRLKDNYRRKNEPQIEDGSELRKRVAMERLEPVNAAGTFEEVEKGYRESEARLECERCARCNLSL